MDGLKTGRSASIAGLYSVKNEHTELSSSRETSVCGDICWTEESTPPVARHGSRKDHGTLVCTFAQPQERFTECVSASEPVAVVKAASAMLKKASLVLNRQSL